MSPEQFTGLIVAITGLVAAVGAVFAQLRQTHNLMNSRMTQLLRETKLASRKRGQQEGAAGERAATTATIVAEGQTWQPTGPHRPSNRDTDAPSPRATKPGG